MVTEAWSRSMSRSTEAVSLYTWFDRPLSISGRVMMRSGDVLAPREVTLDVRRPVAVIPHLAIHFNRAVNDGNPLSVQKDMKPVVGYFSAAEIESYRNHGGVIRSIVAAHLSEQTGKILRRRISLTMNSVSIRPRKPDLPGWVRNFSSRRA